jgi:hypothetical protein
MKEIIYRHQKLIEAHGIEILKEKESFLVEIQKYRDNLILKRDSILEQINKYNEGISILTKKLNMRLGSMYSQSRSGQEKPAMTIKSRNHL